MSSESTDVRRRKYLKALGATGASLLTAGCGEPDTSGMSEIEKREKVLEGADVVAKLSVGDSVDFQPGLPKHQYYIGVSSIFDGAVRVEAVHVYNENNIFEENDVFRNDISVSVNEAEINQLDERVAVFYAGPSAMYEDSDSDTDRAVIGLGDPNGYMAVWAEEYLGENL
ncbi:MAG: hypothetical protein ABEJ03_00435 [Candidatus Nanohaloarchaea archaeon]